MDNPTAAHDEIVQRVSSALRVAVIDTDSAGSQRERPTNPDASDFVIRARSIAAHTMGWREHGARVELLEQALATDPRSLFALTGLADELIRRSKIAKVTSSHARWNSSIGRR